ncbi:cereblon family protein [Pseudodesulfovibrio cashew]|uniref:cereblon family protein n=1 Tax=Pseudodesulfovibrio cashew TaxID=2678688 RepID=UPI0018EEEBF2|nr:cereblon family protein [Pseudodesulfovibrio cashew]
MLYHHSFGVVFPLVCKDGPERDAPGPEEPELTPEPHEGFGDRTLVCRACQSVITRRELAMEVSGQHRHVFFNPYGVVFELGCFASAKNVEPVGPPTDEFTWFPGFAWQVVACSGCRSQLGWRYVGREGGFYGLILKALVEKAGRKA